MPQIPVTPDSPKYTLVPIKKLNVGHPKPTEVQQDDVLPVSPTIPSDFEEEIAKIRIPHMGLPGYITDPPPREDDENDDGEYDEDEEENGEENDEVPNNDHFFTDEFLEPPEFKDAVRPTRPQPVATTTRDRSRDLQFIIRNRPDPSKPLVITTSFPLYATNERFHLKGGSDEDSDEFRQVVGFTSIKSQHEVSNGHSPMLHRQPIRQPQKRPPLLHYGSPKPVSYRHGYPIYRNKRPSMPFVQSQRVYVRYPRHYRTYYQVPGSSRYNRVKVMTQNFVQHPRNYYRSRTPVMMSTAEFRAVKPAGKKKKKKKAKGECKPKKIIKEIHFHHYDPQLSAQLAPLEGINFKEGEDYENDIKVITKETEVKDDVRKGHEDYEQHNENLEKEMDKHKAETEHRLRHPEYYPDSYNPHYSASESTEYIDYNIKTDSESSIREPHPAHEYPDDRSFNTKRFFRTQGVTSNTTKPYTSPPPLVGGRYVKHQLIKYYYKTPNSNQK